MVMCTDLWEALPPLDRAVLPTLVVSHHNTFSKPILPGIAGHSGFTLACFSHSDDAPAAVLGALHEIADGRTLGVICTVSGLDLQNS